MRPHLHRHARAARRCQGQRLGSKASERIKRAPSLGRGKVSGSCPGGGRWDGAGPSRTPMGCEQPSPFPELQPLPSPSEQELRLLEFIKTRTQGSPHQGTGSDGGGEDQGEPWLHPTGGEKRPFS